MVCSSRHKLRALSNKQLPLTDMAFNLIPNYQLPPNVKLLINIGAGFDIVTGSWLKGRNGENILNGGLGYVTGMVGKGNQFKTTILRYQLLQAWNRVEWIRPTSYAEYDTEVNTHEIRSIDLVSRMPSLAGQRLFEEHRWQITDKTVYMANKWFEVTKDFLTGKRDMDKKEFLRTPFSNRERTDFLYVQPPTFGALDSLTELYSDAEAKMIDENELGDSGGNTFHMRAGLVKMRVMMEIPALAAGAIHYIGITGQMGKEIPMNTGPGPAPDGRKLQHLGRDEKIKGVGDKFTFATHNCWHAYRASPLVTKDREAMYPRPGADPVSGDTDLNLVSVKQLRSKSGPTGIILEVIVSQREGLLGSLTEFHFCKELDRFGLEGNNIHYSMALYPEVKLQRTTVRGKIDGDLKLQRAINITSEMCQMKHFQPTDWQEVAITPQELYKKIKDKGHDWDEILQTRGWWTFNDDKHPQPFLSTMDLLLMAQDRYEGPYKAGWSKK